MEKPKEKLFKLWGGNNKFFLDGLIMLGPDSYRIIITLTMILGPEVLFLSTVSKSLHALISATSIFLFTSSVFFLFLVSTSNPGYIPRQDFPFARGPAGSPTIYSALINEPAKPAAIERPYLESCFNSSRIRLKYCRSCFVLRPPRTSHCPDCNLCVERFDHHCPWIGNCIGKKNYSLFFYFLCSVMLLIVFTLAVCIHIILTVDSEESKYIEKISPSVFLLIYCSVMALMIGGLLCFHVYLLLNNLTTNEALKKGIYFPKHNPFARKVRSNFSLLFCAKRFAFYDLRKHVAIDNKNICSVSSAKEAMKKFLNQTDFEITVQVDSPLKPNSASVFPED